MISIKIKCESFKRFSYTWIIVSYMYFKSASQLKETWPLQRDSQRLDLYNATSENILSHCAKRLSLSCRPFQMCLKDHFIQRVMTMHTDLRGHSTTTWTRREGGGSTKSQIYALFDNLFMHFLMIYLVVNENHMKEMFF